MVKKIIPIKVHHAKTIDEAINGIHTFFDCDMYSKFRPEIKIQGKKMYRQDWFKSEKEFSEYLQAHFDILRKEIKRIRRKKK